MAPDSDQVESPIALATLGLTLCGELGGARGSPGRGSGRPPIRPPPDRHTPNLSLCRPFTSGRVMRVMRVMLDLIRGLFARKPFRVGTRVRDHLQGEGIVVGYEYGPLNNIVVRLDDGREVRRVILLDGEDTAGLERADQPRPAPPPPAMTFVSVYEDGGRLFFVSLDRTEGGMWIDGEIAERDGEASPAEVGEAVLAGLGASRMGVPDPEDVTTWGDRLARRAGAARWTSFARQARLVSAESGRPPGDLVILTPHRPLAGAGFEGVSDQAVQVAADAVVVGEALRGLLDEIA